MILSRTSRICILRNIINIQTGCSRQGQYLVKSYLDVLAKDACRRWFTHKKGWPFHYVWIALEIWEAETRLQEPLMAYKGVGFILPPVYPLFFNHNRIIHFTPVLNRITYSEILSVVDETVSNRDIRIRSVSPNRREITSVWRKRKRNFPGLHLVTGFTLLLMRFIMLPCPDDMWEDGDTELAIGRRINSVRFGGSIKWKLTFTVIRKLQAFVEASLRFLIGVHRLDTISN